MKSMELMMQAVKRIKLIKAEVAGKLMNIPLVLMEAK